MPLALIMIGKGDVTVTTPVTLELSPEFSGPKYKRLRTLEINRLLTEGFTEALNRHDADNPLSNDTFIMVSFEGLPTERKD